MVPSEVCSFFLFTGAANFCACCHFLSVSHSSYKPFLVLIANFSNELLTPVNLARSRPSSLHYSKSLACLTFRSMEAELQDVGGTGGGDVDFAYFSGSGNLVKTVSGFEGIKPLPRPAPRIFSFV